MGQRGATSGLPWGTAGAFFAFSMGNPNSSPKTQTPSLVHVRKKTLGLRDTGRDVKRAGGRRRLGGGESRIGVAKSSIIMSSAVNVSVNGDDHGSFNDTKSKLRRIDAENGCHSFTAVEVEPVPYHNMKNWYARTSGQTYYGTGWRGLLLPKRPKAVDDPLRILPSVYKSHWRRSTFLICFLLAIWICWKLRNMAGELEGLR
ncbi:hypothetical protein I352_05296 [Cryptococcus deuterogattii MMRL2647]|nr:hypothetical protein I352_05296 [Cryptococcus deuterogattii MMRL2647]